MRLIAGVDEVGRGPLAGPVVACAVIMPPDARAIAGVADSKRLVAAERTRLAVQIRRRALALVFASNFSSRLLNYATSVAEAEEAHILAEEKGDNVALIFTLIARSFAASSYAQIEALLVQGLELSRAAGSPNGCRRTARRARRP